MLIDERKNQILGITKEKTYVSVEELSKRVFASPATIRRDLADLERAGLIQRVRGGASNIAPSTGEVSSIVRKQTMVVEKRRMATAALQFMKDGRSYFFDSSTTVGEIIPMLGKTHDVTIITTGLENAFCLSSVTNCNTYIAGGQVQNRAASTIGGDAIDFIKHFNCDAFVFSCHGFSIKAGPTEGTIEQQRCKKAMLENSAQHILLVDHTKFGSTLVASFCPLSDIDVLITDLEPTNEYKEALSHAGVELIVV